MDDATSGREMAASMERRHVASTVSRLFSLATWLAGKLAATGADPRHEEQLLAVQVGAVEDGLDGSDG
jgi:hypothetical protein